MARIAELESEVEMERPRKLDEIALSSAESVLKELVTAYGISLKKDRRATLRGLAPRMIAALTVAKTFVGGTGTID